MYGETIQFRKLYLLRSVKRSHFDRTNMERKNFKVYFVSSFATLIPFQMRINLCYSAEIYMKNT